MEWAVETYIVHDRRNLLVIAHLEIKVECLAMTAVPRERPTHSLVESRDLLIRRARDSWQNIQSVIDFNEK
jgi:hypothetical protein